MLLLGIDIGTSSVKVSVVDSNVGKIIATASYPEWEAEIISFKQGWAEQSPDQWWEFVKQAILKCHAIGNYNSKDISAIGIAYQMHGLVVIDKQQHILRNSIIWCDSRAVEIGNNAFKSIGEATCLGSLLNSPGNFTASKLAWVKMHEPSLFEQIYKIMLPGDFIAMKMTDEVTTSISALSEGVFWDFRNNQLSTHVLEYFGFDNDLFPIIKPVFSVHGLLKEATAARLQLRSGIPISYKAGDQPNNALSLNVLEPGEVAATAGTSGVIYGVSDDLCFDTESRINTFAHVNHSTELIRTGSLLCVNGTGIFNRWIKNIAGTNYTYSTLNELAYNVPMGSEGLMTLPFGNGAERIFHNRIIGAHFHQLNLNKHTTGHLVRAVQEGIAFSLRYGLDIMRENGINPTVVRAGKTNLFLSDVFTTAFSSVNNVSVEFYEGDGSYGAAIGAGIGAGIYVNPKEVFQFRKPISMKEPSDIELYEELYQEWKQVLNNQLHYQSNLQIQTQ